ncbi:MAG: 16S rRNA (adenine(1518)-N(6)/adenine(1519)-N(6))-dimethyltransferase RsmA [Patescibacteria group bacterium]
MTLLEETLDLCKIYKIIPNKLLGQNFLIDETVLDDIIGNTLEIKKERKVKKLNILEVGGGFGVLTNRLIDIADKVFLIEKDEKLFNGLKKIENVSNGKLKVVLNDALNLQYETKKNNSDDALLVDQLKEFFNGEEFFVVANIPYSITSFLIRILLEMKYAPKEIIIMIQKEVADRICAKSGDDTVLSISAKFYSLPSILFLVSRKCFYPSPEVDSAIIRLSRKKDFNIIDKKEVDRFFKFVKSGFSNKRKMLHHNITSVYREDKEFVKNIIIESGLSEKTRAQDLGLDDWFRLWYNFNNKKIKK